MQHVKATWLRNYTYALVFFDLLIGGAFVWLRLLNGPQAIVSIWGITPLVVIIVGIHALYSVSIYQLLYKKFTWIANVISLSIWGYFLVTVIDTSGHTFLIYRLGLVLYIFFMGLDGPFPPLAAVLLVWIILLLTVSNALAGGSAPLLFNFIVDVLVSFAGVGGWILFKRFYTDPQSLEESQLANLLKQEQFKSSTIIESITDGVMIINSKGTVQLLNKSAAEMLGWSQNEALNLNYRSLVKSVSDTGDESPETAISVSLASGKPAQTVSLLETRNQHHMYTDIVASPIYQTVRTPEGVEQKTIVGTIAVLRDVDQQKREEQQRSDFISTASHEMRTPVASIQGFIELALNPKVATIDEKAKGYLLKAHEATQHLGELFQDLLTVSKSEDGRLANKPKLIEVGEFLSEIVAEDRLTAEKKGLKVSLELGGGTGGNNKTITPLFYVNVDPDRLREVVSDLFENAVKYTKAGMITVGASLRDQSVIIRVADTGMGIAQEDIPHLFQKFYRTDNSETREIGGTGLGLYICKQIVEMMNGKIWVESTVGTGSTFYVEIPRVPPDTIEKVRAAAQE